jgi:CheY-like chemotaxis protein
MDSQYCRLQFPSSCGILVIQDNHSGASTMKAWLRSDSATLGLLLLGLGAQMPHAAALFHWLARNADSGWLGWLHAYAYALALESATLLFVMRGRQQWAWAFAAASIAVNAGYYWQPSMELADMLRAALISIMLPVAIARYSHEVAESDATEQAPAASAAPKQKRASTPVAASTAPAMQSNLLEVLALQAEQEQEREREQPSEQFACKECDFVGATRQSLAAHSRKHKPALVVVARRAMGD